MQDPGQVSCGMKGDPVRPAFRSATRLQPLQPREGPSRQPMTCSLGLGQVGRCRRQTFRCHGWGTVQGPWMQ